MAGKWVPLETRDQIVHFTDYWANKTDLPILGLLKAIGISSDRFYDWKKRQGERNKHNGLIPKSTWLTPMEKAAILEYHARHPLNGYRRLCYMMLDEDVVACSPRSVHRVLSEAGRIDKQTPTDSNKGKGFDQPSKPHQHWHIDISYLNIAGTFYYLCSILDGYSRFLVHHELREQMTETDVEIVLERALEAHPGVSPRVISDRGPQFIAKDFKTYVRLCGMSHVLTSPYYPQSNGKIERWHRELKKTIRPKSPKTLEEARRNVSLFVESYNYQRLHSGIGYVTPYDRLLGIDQALFLERKSKINLANTKRQSYWKNQSLEQRQLSANAVAASMSAFIRGEAESEAASG